MNFKLYLITAIKASVKAGAEILNIYNSNHSNLNIEKKSDNSPVTEADKKANKIICEILTMKNDLPVLSEEGDNIDYEIRKHWNYFWLIDPLDGTKEFINRNGEFTVNIALMYKDHPVFGIIYAPVPNLLYFSYDNISYKIELTNPETIEMIDFTNLIRSSEVISSSKKPETYTIIGSRSHQTRELEDFIETQKSIYKNLEFISAGSSLKFCKMAEGEAHIYPRIGYTMEWDTAAGHSICNGAGLLVKIFGTQKQLTYNKKQLRNPFFIVE